jgi:hypothetical protein
MTERWLPVIGYETLYEVSDLGNVRSLDRLIVHRDGHTQRRRGKNLALALSEEGRPLITLSRLGKAKPSRVQTLVLEAFVGPRPTGMVCCHANDIVTDNRLTNLRWDTRSANNFDAVTNGRNQQVNKTHCPAGHKYTAENTCGGSGSG